MDNELVVHAGVGKGRCKSCKKPFVWAYTPGGKKAPFEPDDEGEWVLENGTARHVGPKPAQLELGAAPGPQRYTSHFSTCPFADQHRQSRGRR